jgi:predicted metal-dependent hydrolase
MLARFLAEQLQLWGAEGPAATPAASPLKPTPDRTVLLCGQPVPYRLRRSSRRTIGFQIGTEGLLVSAPKWVGLSEIEAALRTKADWILRKLHDQQVRQRQQEAGRIVWEAGAPVPYLGRYVVLNLRPEGGRSTGQAVLEGGSADAVERLCLALPTDAEPSRIRDAVHAWWQREALQLFRQRCDHFAPRLGVQVQRLGLSTAQTRWGSATAQGAIRLNWRLIHYPLSSIDYVVVHELAHLRELNHSAAFWEVVRSVMPDFEVAQAPLRQVPIPLD